MKPSVAAVSVGAFALLFAGCGKQPGVATKTEEPVAIGPQYSAKKGLLVPTETRESLGLRMVDVGEQKIPVTIDVQLRVYRNSGSRTLASAMLPAEKAALLTNGHAVQVRTQRGRTLTGAVVSVNAAMQKVAGATELLVEIPHKEEQLAVGSFLQARVTLEPTGTVATIPRTALLQCSDGYSVYTLSGDHLVRTPIKVGATTDEFVEVTDGLYAGDKVVLQPVMSLWLTELAFVKGGQACCVEPKKK